MIGGSGPKRTLPLVARFATVWNALYGSPDRVRERSALLDRLLEAEGRQPADVRRTLPVVCWRTPEELETRLSTARRFPAWPALIGTPETVVSQIWAFAAAGVGEIALQWIAADDIERLEMLASEVLPHLTP